MVSENGEICVLVELLNKLGLDLSVVFLDFLCLEIDLPNYIGMYR